MRRSKYGYLLLALLVTTGLAGTVTSTSISGKERKFIAAHLKDTRSDLVRTVKGLARPGVDFKVNKNDWSVRQCVYHIAFSEKYLWSLLQQSLKQPANPEKRLQVKCTDEEVLSMAETGTRDINFGKSHTDAVPTFATLEEALESFKSTRADHFKYMKNTTEDLRNHLVEMPFGWIDCYQLSLMISGHCNRHMQEIEKIKADPKFP